MKKNNLRRCILCLLLVCIAGVFPVDDIFAREMVNGGAKLRTEIDTYEKEENMVKVLQKKKSQLSEAQKRDLAGKMKILNEEKNAVKQNGTPSIKKKYYAKVLNVKHFKQKNGYYCGPATTKQTLQYITGKSPSQDTIAKALGTTKNGTDGKQIVNYLNIKQKQVNFMISDTTDSSKLKSRIYHDISVANTPAIARLKFEAGGSWEYGTDGHFLNVSGFTENIQRVHLTDPNITRASKKIKLGNIMSPLRYYARH